MAVPFQPMDSVFEQAHSDYRYEVFYRIRSRIAFLLSQVISYHLPHATESNAASMNGPLKMSLRTVLAKMTTICFVQLILFDNMDRNSFRSLF